MNFCLNNRHAALEDVVDRLKSEIYENRDAASRELSASQVQVEKLQAELDAHAFHRSRLMDEIDQLREEKKQLLEDLLIASGVKMSKIQEKYLEREMDASQKEPNYTGQSRHWAQSRQMDAMQEQARDKRSEAQEIIRRLELEADIGGQE